MKSKDEAIAGYQRYIDLHSAAGKPSDKSWHGIGKRNLVPDYAKSRLTALRGQQ
ncbi:hypothetical protein [Vulcaniibacterium tengchongense]|uniref:hypothetical protein n=1 Tax=Vulcaniibacterium tengchongense TaxID=1273429 RepID=UPI0013156E80|nr:hypothetical protein [Vulcaniibacterium tengchongense]